MEASVIRAAMAELCFRYDFLEENRRLLFDIGISSADTFKHLYAIRYRVHPFYTATISLVVFYKPVFDKLPAKAG